MEPSNRGFIYSKSKDHSKRRKKTEQLRNLIGRWRVYHNTKLQTVVCWTESSDKKQTRVLKMEGGAILQRLASEEVKTSQTENNTQPEVGDNAAIGT